MRPTSEGHCGKTPVITCQDLVDPLSPQMGMEGWGNQPELEFPSVTVHSYALSHDLQYHKLYSSV